MQLRDRNLFRHKSEQERDRLLAKVERNPEDARSVFFLAETYFQYGRFRRRAQVVCAAGRDGRLRRGGLLGDVPARGVDGGTR